MSQRRLDGVIDRPPRAQPEPACDDCGVTEAAHRNDSRRYPDGKMLRKYSDGGYGCKPCSNGGSEPFNEDPYFPSQGEFIADKVFPKIPVAEQENETFTYVGFDKGRFGK